MKSLRSIRCARWLAILTAAYALTLPIVRTARAETPAEHLMAIVDSDDLDKIAAYLAQPGVGINDRPGNVKTMLDFAADKNLVRVAQYLIDHGADVSQEFGIHQAPLGSLLPPMIDPQTNEEFPGDFLYNPYSGGKLRTR